MLSDNLKLKAGLALSAVFVVVALAAPGSASAKCVTGGLTPAAVDVCTPTAKAKLLSTGELIPPKSAPPRVVAVIEAANKIRTKPYIYGGGHARWWDRGYDCSGAVSFALYGAGLLDTPLVSGSLASYGEPGPGKWITIYANAGHTYAVIAGLRWDTAGNPEGVSGPRWHVEPPYPEGYEVRHPVGY